MANLLIEIGNTALKAAWAEGTVLGKTFRYQGEKYLDYILALTEKDRPDVIAVISKVDFSVEETEKLASRCNMLLLPGRENFLRKYSLPQYLSAERASSLVAVKYLFESRPVSVFDFGTTLSVDFIDGEGKYGGGVISPGCRTRFKALNRYSRTLPLVDTPENIGETGKSLVSSIESGVISGILFEIEGYVSRYPENIVVFTGGDASYFAARMNSSVFTVDNLVLIGLSIITDDYVKKGIA